MERYAVDFGTSNTVVARWNFAKEEPQTMSFPAITAPGSGAMPPVTPSVLYYRGEESFLMGYEVTSRGLDDIRSSRYFWGFKRGLLHLTSLYEDRGREFSADHIARLYLTRLLGNLELNADTVVTFTAPVNAFDTYREWISAFFAENYPDVPYRLVDESVAAAISYGSTRAGSVVCVVDFGGGTLDVSVVRMPESFAGAAAGEVAKGRVLGKAGAFLGGDDIDRWLLEDLLMRAGRTAEECEEILPQLTTLARQIKEELSAQSESSRSFFDAEHFKTYEFRYTQNDLLDLLEEHDFFVTLNDVLNNAVNMAEAGGISRSQIERVLLVGGTTLIPAVQRGIRGIFGREKVQCHKPFEAVAHGALAFSLGMFIPMELNAPLVVGGLVAWYVSTRSKDDAVNKARLDRGTLIASGFIAGGALMGVVSAVLKFAGADWYFGQWASSNGAEWLGLAMYAALIGYMAWHTMRAKPEQE